MEAVFPGNYADSSSVAKQPKRQFCWVVTLWQVTSSKQNAVLIEKQLVFVFVIDGAVIVRW